MVVEQGRMGQYLLFVFGGGVGEKKIPQSADLWDGE